MLRLDYILHELDLVLLVLELLHKLGHLPLVGR
jgi:hypothetical protein